MTFRRKFFLLTFLALYGSSVGAEIRNVAGAGSQSLCDLCACEPNNAAPVTVNCSCTKTTLMIFREHHMATLSTAKELMLSSCGYVSLHPSGLPSSAALSRVTVRDFKLFHYTVGLFPSLESLSVEDVDELVLDGFGLANRTLQYLTLRRTKVVKMVRGALTTGVPLRRVLFDQVNIEEIESGALDMAFAVNGDNGRLAADGFTVVGSTIKKVQSNGITVRSGAVRFLNNTLDDLAPNAVTVDDADKGSNGVQFTGNRFGRSFAGDSVVVVRSDGTNGGSSGGNGDVQMDGNEFRSLPADLQVFKSERAVEFRDNRVDDVDLGPFLFGVGPAVRATGNRFACDCDPRRITVLKLNQVFPGLLPSDTRLAQLLENNLCAEPANTTLAGYRDLLVKEIACEGANVTTVSPPPPKQRTSDDGVGTGTNAAPVAAPYVTVFAAAVAARSFLHYVGVL